MNWYGFVRLVFGFRGAQMHPERVILRVLALEKMRAQLKKSG